MDKEKILNRWRNPPPAPLPLPVEETTENKELREARQEKKRVATEVKELVAMSQELNRLADNCEKLSIPLSSLAELAQQVAQRMENLPLVGMEETAERPMYFILCGEGWYPAHSGVIGSACGMDNWLNYNVRYGDGQVESGPMRPYRWAHCTADDQPNYHWLDRMRNEWVPRPMKEELVEC